MGKRRAQDACPQLPSPCAEVRSNLCTKLPTPLNPWTGAMGKKKKGSGDDRSCLRQGPEPLRVWERSNICTKPPTPLNRPEGRIDNGDGKDRSPTASEKGPYLSSIAGLRVEG
jgi:hypothetical protein